MELLDAKLRLKELTQELYNIGDEVAEYTEHIEEAIADWDADLVVDCLVEFSEIVDEAIHDSRVVSSELLGIRGALTSGLRSGTMSVWDAVPRVPLYQQPPLVDEGVLRAAYPCASLAAVGEMERVFTARSEHARSHLATIVEWVLDQTACAASELRSVNLSTVHTRARRLVTAVSTGWLATVAQENPGYVASMRGSHPPGFLAERAWVDSVVAGVREQLRSASAGA